MLTRSYQISSRLNAFFQKNLPKQNSPGPYSLTSKCVPLPCGCGQSDAHVWILGSACRLPCSLQPLISENTCMISWHLQRQALLLNPDSLRLYVIVWLQVKYSSFGHQSSKAVIAPLNVPKISENYQAHGEHLFVVRFVRWVFFFSVLKIICNFRAQCNGPFAVSV